MEANKLYRNKIKGSTFMDQPQIVMRKPIEIWQFMVSVMVLILTAGSMIVNQSNKITSQEIRIIDLEQNKKDTKDQFDKVNEKLDGMSDQLTQIRISLEDKANRTNR